MCRPGSEIVRIGSPRRITSAWLVCGTVNSEKNDTKTRARRSSATTPPTLKVMRRLRAAPGSCLSSSRRRRSRDVTLFVAFMSVSTPAAGPGSGTRIGIADAIGINVEWRRDALDDLLGDHHLLDAVQARQVEHGVEQDGLHQRAQAARPGLALHRLAGDGAQRILGEAQFDVLHLEQPPVLLDQGV